MARCTTSWRPACRPTRASDPRGSGAHDELRGLAGHSWLNRPTPRSSCPDPPVPRRVSTPPQGGPGGATLPAAAPRSGAALAGPGRHEKNRPHAGRRPTRGSCARLRNALRGGRGPGPRTQQTSGSSTSTHRSRSCGDGALTVASGGRHRAAGARAPTRGSDRRGCGGARVAAYVVGPGSRSFCPGVSVARDRPRGWRRHPTRCRVPLSLAGVSCSRPTSRRKRARLPAFFAVDARQESEIVRVHASDARVTRRGAGDRSGPAVQAVEALGLVPAESPPGRPHLGGPRSRHLRDRAAARGRAGAAAAPAGT